LAVQKLTKSQPCNCVKYCCRLAISNVLCYDQLTGLTPMKTCRYTVTYNSIFVSRLCACYCISGAHFLTKSCYYVSV